MFYLSAMPMGLPEARAEGTYLIVNKNLIEAAAVLVLLSFRTGEIAGLDQLWRATRVRSDRAAFARVENRDLTPTKEMSL
jgi:thiosulfate dehydrogenase [quinone] large subunit